MAPVHWSASSPSPLLQDLFVSPDPRFSSSSSSFLPFAHTGTGTARDANGILNRLRNRHIGIVTQHDGGFQWISNRAGELLRQLQNFSSFRGKCGQLISRDMWVHNQIWNSVNASTLRAFPSLSEAYVSSLRVLFRVVPCSRHEF